MAGLYERLREAWNSIKGTLRLGRRQDEDSYDELCSRLKSGKPIEAEELDHIRALCKSIAEPQCGKKIEDGFETLKRIAAEKGAGGVGKKRRRVEEEEEAHGSKEGPVRGVKKRRRRRYQGKHVLRKEDDVSWGVLPKRYRGEGKTGIETIEKAIGYDKEDNLFLHLGEVSSDEELEYFCERNVKRLNSEPFGKEGDVRCNFGGEYNCKKCVEYEVRKEYEARERERERRESERAEQRKKAAKERWEAKVPRSYFYLEKDIGVGRGVARYVTDDKFDMDDLEEAEKEKLGHVLNQARKAQLFDIDKIEGKKVSFDENRNEVSEISFGPSDLGRREERVENPENDGDDGSCNVSGDLMSSADRKDPSAESAVRIGTEANSAVASQEQAPEIGPGENGMGIGAPFVFGGGFGKPVAPEEQRKLDEEKQEETPKRFGFWDGRMPSVDGKPSVFQFGSGSPIGGKSTTIHGEGQQHTQDSPSTVNHESVSSPFASNPKAPEVKPFVPGLGPMGHGAMGMDGSVPTQPSPELGGSLFKRKLGGFGEADQGSSKPSFSFGQTGGSGNISQIPGVGTFGQGFSLFGGGAQGVGGMPPQGSQTTNIFGNGASLFGGFIGENGPSQQPAKPSIGYADPSEKSGQGSSGVFGSGIFNVADDDPFEKGGLGGRR